MRNVSFLNNGSVEKMKGHLSSGGQLATAKLGEPDTRKWSHRFFFMLFLPLTSQGFPGVDSVVNTEGSKGSFV